MGLGGGCFESDVATMHANGGPFYDVVDTYGHHGNDNLSFWLANAKEAAAKITEATRAREREKEEKYGKFLRDLHSRVALSANEKQLSKIPQARHRGHLHGQTDSDFSSGRSKFDGPAVHDKGRDLGSKNLSKQVPKMDKVRQYLEKQLRRNSNGAHGISKLHRECMIQALIKDKAIDFIEEKACSTQKLGEDKSSFPKETECTLSKLITKPYFASLAPTTTPQTQDTANSESCTPTGWNMIPTSFSALQMRSLESATSSAPADIREGGDLIFKSTRKSSLKENSKHRHVKIHGVRVSGRPKSSLSRSCRGGLSELREKENLTPNTSIDNGNVKDNSQVHTKEPPSFILSGDSKRKQSQSNVSVGSSCLSSEGVTACPMGVIVLKGREEYESRGQGKQFFSDVWKCAMEVERRCAHERAHSLHILNKKRLEQQKAEKRHKAELLREKCRAKQREAVQMQLENVATLKARRESIVQRHRAVEKKRFSHALQAVRMEKMQEYGVQVPPLCACGHRVHPLNVNYIKKCYSNCPLRNNFLEYTLRLENTLQQLLDDFNASSYSKEIGIRSLRTQCFYDSRGCC